MQCIDGHKRMKCIHRRYRDKNVELYSRNEPNKYQNTRELDTKKAQASLI